MEFRAIFRYLRLCAITCLVISGLAASEHHGLVRFGTIPVPGATVTATKGDKKVVAVTDESGIYIFPELEDGVWKIQVEMLTFTTLSKEIGIATGAPGAEWELKMQSLDEMKPTAAAAPPPSTPATTAATPPAAAGAAAQGAGATPSIVAANASANAAAAAAAPPAGKGGKNNGKKPTAAASTNPGTGFTRTDVNASADTPAASGAAAAGPPPSNVAEASSASDAFVVNGSSSNGIERRAIGNGRKGPRSLFNGGIDFRGFRNDYLDARNYSLTGQDTPRSPYTDFTVGGSVQGPLWAPHVFHWQGSFGVTFGTTRNRNASNVSATMPTLAERGGDFSQISNIIMDPTTHQPVPNNIIPSGNISQQAKDLLTFYPQPQFAANGLGNNYQAPTVSKGYSDQLQVRVNKPINNRNSLNFQFTWQDNHNQNNNVFSFVDQSQTSNYRGHVGYNHNFNRSVFGSFYLDYSRTRVLSTPFFANVTNVSGNFGITGNSQNPLDWGPPGLGFSDIYGLSDGSSNFVRNQTASGGGSMNWYHRPHSFQFGGDFKLQTFSTVGQSNPRGSFGFNGQASGFDFADFLYGVPDTSAIAYGNADKYLKDYIYDAFINDDWKVSSSFTFQWGVRWDYGTPVTEEYGRMVNLDIAPGYSNAVPVLGCALQPALSPSGLPVCAHSISPVGSVSGYHFPNTLINPDRSSISPRLSFAWRPIFGSSMVVRGGYGIYYNTGLYNAIANRMLQQSPLSKTLNVSNSPTDPLTLANGFTPSPTVTPTTFGVDPNYRLGYTHQYYVSVQQNVTASLLLTAQYSGVRGFHAAQEFQPNTYAPGLTNPYCATCLPGYTYLNTNGTSLKNAGSLTARRRFHGGVSTLFTYTYSKAIDDAGGLGSAFGSIAQNWLDLAAERARSSFDQRHLFTASLQYSTGVGVHGGALLSGWRGQIFKGWTFQSNVNVGSGLPFTPISSFAMPGTGTGGLIRADYLSGDAYASNIPGRYLNVGAYGLPSGHFGDAGRDSLTGPNQFSWNGSMARSFLEKFTVTFQAQNVLNHPVYGGWNSTFVQTCPVGTVSCLAPNGSTVYQGGQFGQLLAPGSGSMRIITATIRWTF